MRLSGPALTSRDQAAAFAAIAGFRLVRALGWLIAGTLHITQAAAQPTSAATAKDEFSSLVKLAPFVVSGKSLAVSIYARTGSDRRYGEAFAERVVKVVYEAVTESTGKGLVIIGAKGEPHPFLVFRKFLALATDGKLDPAIAARAPELQAMIDNWQHVSVSVDDDTDSEGIDLGFEKIFPALPLPLAGIGAKLYQLAWEEKFDDVKVETKLRALRAGDLERRDRFKAFDWVFFLPPKGAFDRVLDELIDGALKQEKLGFVARTAVRGILLVLKPKIRRVIEGMREGMMLKTVVQAQTKYTEDEVSALTNAYIEVFEPFQEEEKKTPGKNDHERAVNAVRAQLRKNAEEMKKPVATEASEASRSELEK